jgi:hypothetical protein
MATKGNLLRSGDAEFIDLRNSQKMYIRPSYRDLELIFDNTWISAKEDFMYGPPCALVTGTPESETNIDLDLAKLVLMRVKPELIFYQTTASPLVTVYWKDTLFDTKSRRHPARISGSYRPTAILSHVPQRDKIEIWSIADTTLQWASSPSTKCVSLLMVRRRMPHYTSRSG